MVVHSQGSKSFNFKQNFELEDVILINFIDLSNEEREMVRNWRNNENIRKWMYTDHFISKEEHYRFLESLKQDKKNYYWLVKNKNNKYLGVMSFTRVDFKNRNAYFGIYSNPDEKIPGMGILLDMIAISLSFRIAKLHSLKLEVIEDNRQVVNLHQKMGFIEEGRLREFIVKDKIWKDVIVMGMINKKEQI